MVVIARRPIEPTGKKQERTGAALRDAASKLGAGQPQEIAQHPEKGHIGGSVDIFFFVVYAQTDHEILANASRRWQGGGFRNQTIERPAETANGQGSNFTAS